MLGPGVPLGADGNAGCLAALIGVLRDIGWGLAALWGFNELTAQAGVASSQYAGIRAQHLEDVDSIAAFYGRMQVYLFGEAVRTQVGLEQPLLVAVRFHRHPLRPSAQKLVKISRC